MNLYFKIIIIFVFLASTFGCNKKTAFENLNIINIEASSITNLSEIIEEIEYVLIEKPNVPINQIDKFFILNEHTPIIRTDFIWHQLYKSSLSFPYFHT